MLRWGLSSAAREGLGVVMGFVMGLVFQGVVLGGCLLVRWRPGVCHGSCVLPLALLHVALGVAFRNASWRARI
jgi:hypothetical protein